VLDQLDRLCARENEYIWLQQDAQPGAYHDHVAFRRALRSRLLDFLEDEFRVASGLLDERRAKDLFDRYIVHVGNWLKGEKVRNPVTGAAEEPDVRLMEEVERRLGSADKAEELRRSLVSQIAGWVIERPDEPIDHARIFAAQIRQLESAVFAEKAQAIARLCRDLVILLRGEGSGLSDARRKELEAMMGRLRERFGYEEGSAADAAAALTRERFAESLG
jgi:hypothetical protein